MVNGKTVSGQADKSLLNFLCEDLGLKGAKNACGGDGARHFQKDVKST